MRTMMVRALLSLIAVGPLSAAALAEDWTGPKDVAKAAHEFAGIAGQLQKAIKDIAEDSPLVEEVRLLAKSAGQIEDAVGKGATFEAAKKDFRKLEGDYAHFEAGLKKAHDVHHEKSVEDAAKKVKAALEQLKDHMAGRRPAEKAGEANPRPAREDNR